MPKVDCIIHHASQVVTCANNSQPKRGEQMRDVGIIPNGALAFKDGVIVAVDTTQNITANYVAEKVIDASGRAVIAGLVDCHTHLVFGGDRLDEFEMKIQGAPYMEILANGGGILSTMRATRQASLEELIQRASRHLDVMLSLGTTTAEIKTGYGLDTENEVKMMRAIIALMKQSPLTITPTFLGAHAVPPEHNLSSYTDYLINDTLPPIIDLLKDVQQPYFVDVFCEKGVFDLESSRRILQTAHQQGAMGIKAHVDEFVNLRGVTMAVDLGAVSVDHLDVTPEDELKVLARSNTVGVMLPAVNFHLGSAHFATARTLLDNGGILALSTDYNPGSAPTLSLPMVMSIACRYQKVTPAEALNACTINAATALGLQDRVGSLEVGKQADCVILDVPDYRALAYEFGAGMVEQVFIKGESVWTR
jgi:imidazolonepropionase